jgi:prepilin-type N-terminal cleavage/methylation domain-containing protein
MLFTKRIRKSNQKGFTLLEVLLVVAIIAILAGIVIIAINPNKQLADTRNSQRQADVTTILNGVYQYIVDSNGTVPSTITTSALEICKSSVLDATCAGASPVLVGLSGTVTLNSKYLASMPIDPSCPTGCHASGNGTGYRITKDATTNRITVNAPNAVADGKTISVTR